MAKTAKPNIRKMFVPSKDHVIFEVDLKQGDAQIVAWEAQDEKLMNTFEAQSRGELRNGYPIDIHTENALDIFPDLVLVKGKAPPAIRKISKSGVHGTNYAGSAYALAHKLGTQIRQMERFQLLWFKAHPAIREWHKRIEYELITTRSTTNLFGYRRFWFGRPAELLPEALAWKPQSMIALIINAGIRNVRKELPFLQRLMQVHDSALYQTHKSNFSPELIKAVEKCHLIPLPYPRPLTVGVDIKHSEISWGDCE